MAAGYLAATAIRIKAHCAFHSWISAINPSETDEQQALAAIKVMYPLGFPASACPDARRNRRP
jgi:hypothetical protein